MLKQRSKRTKHAKEQALSRDGKLSFQHILESQLDRVMYYALCEYGLRVSEFTHMREEWLDREQGLISIPASQPCNCKICTKNKDHPGVWEPKTSAGSRVIPAEKLSHEGWDHLTSWFDRNKEIRLTRFQVYHRVRHFGKLIGLPKLHPHSLRATAAISMSTRPEVTTTVLTGLMGWEKLGTAEIYIDASKSDVLKAFGITPKGRTEPQVVQILPDWIPRKPYTRKKKLPSRVRSRMSFATRARLVKDINPELRAKMFLEVCAICDRKSPVCLHHINPAGPDNLDNLIMLCSTHHDIVHNTGFGYDKDAKIRNQEHIYDTDAKYMSDRDFQKWKTVLEAKKDFHNGSRSIIESLESKWFEAHPNLGFSDKAQEDESLSPATAELPLAEASLEQKLEDATVAQSVEQQVCNLPDESSNLSSGSIEVEPTTVEPQVEAQAVEEPSSTVVEEQYDKCPSCGSKIRKSDTGSWICFECGSYGDAKKT